MFEAFFVGGKWFGAVYALYCEVELMVRLAQFVWHGFRIIHFAERHVVVLVANIENVLRMMLQFLFLSCCQLRECLIRVSREPPTALTHILCILDVKTANNHFSAL